MDNRLMRRHINTAVLLCAAKTKHMVVFINRTAYRAQRIVAVCENIRHRKPFKPRSPGSLDNSHKSNIMGSQLVELDFQPVHIPGRIVFFQNTISNRPLPCLFSGNFLPCLFPDGRGSLRPVRYNFRAIY